MRPSKHMGILFLCFCCWKQKDTGWFSGWKKLWPGPLQDQQSLFKKKFFFIIFDLQCYVTFCCTAECPRHTHMYILFLILSSIVFYPKRLDIATIKLLPFFEWSEPASKNGSSSPSFPVPREWVQSGFFDFLRESYNQHFLFEVEEIRLELNRDKLRFIVN